MRRKHSDKVRFALTQEQTSFIIEHLPACQLRAVIEENARWALIRAGKLPVPPVEVLRATTGT